MKRALILIILLWNKSFSQKENLFKDVSIDSSTILVAMYPYYDSEKVYENYNFYIDNFKEIDSLKNIIQYGEKLNKTWFETNSQGTNSGFLIKLITKDTVLREWQVYPKYSSILLKGGSYFFDYISLKPLADKHHLKYKYYKKSFSNESEYEVFYSDLRKNKKLIYIEKPNFKIEGRFDVQFIKSDKFSSPKAIMEYIASKFKNEGADKYYLSYAANEYNLKNKNQYTISIQSSELFYNLYNNTESSKGTWEPDKHTAIIFLKK